MTWEVLGHGDETVAKTPPETRVTEMRYVPVSATQTEPTWGRCGSCDYHQTLEVGSLQTAIMAPRSSPILGEFEAFLTEYQFKSGWVVCNRMLMGRGFSCRGLIPGGAGRRGRCAWRLRRRKFSLCQEVCSDLDIWNPDGLMTAQDVSQVSCRFQADDEAGPE